MKKRISIIIFLIISLSLNLSVFAQHQHQAPEIKKEETFKTPKPKKLYRCPMHPQVVLDKPGKCPICGMELVEIIAEEVLPEGKPQESIVKVTEKQQELINIQTESVLSRPLMRMIRTVAQIAFDPELYKAEQEFIQAIKMKERLGVSQSPEIIQRAEALVVASEFKLKLQGLTDQQIEELKDKTEGDRALLISDAQTTYSWAYAVIYEYDIGLVKIGEEVTLKAIAYPNEEFKGTIKAIDPVLDANTRSVRIRALIDNPESRLKPNMYADIFIHIDLGTHLAVPREAILDTGLRKIAYLDLGNGQFKAQEIEVGPEAVSIVDGQERKFFPVIKGLEENNIVVTKGNFLIDSQSQLTGGMSALWGGATEIKQETGHRH